MKYKKKILQLLIGKYEKSKAAVSGSTTRKIAVQLSKEKGLNNLLEDIDEKRSFLKDLQELKEAGMVDYSWEKYEEGNLVDRIWLLYEPTEKLYQAYEMVGLIPMQIQLEQCRCAIENCMKVIHKEWILEFLKECLETMDERKKLPKFFQGSRGQYLDLLKALTALDSVDTEILERVFSTRVYGNSKWFEKNVRSKFISVMRHIKREENDQEFEDDELLLMAGIARYPEVMEFRGKVLTELYNGARIDYSQQVHGAYINSNLAEEVKRVHFPEVSKVLFIENKANYIWYLMNYNEGDELIVFHGGFYSPAKGKWFQKIYESSLEKQISFYHWSDIDKGGMDIFCRLRDSIIPKLQPYKMDIETFEAYKNRGIKITENAYKRKLEAMRNDERYCIFYDLLEAILESGVIIEQEMMIVE